jgi:cell division protein FtsQ
MAPDTARLRRGELEPARAPRGAGAGRDLAPRRARAGGAVEGRTPDRPSGLRLWLRRRRGWLRPAALGLLGAGALAALGAAVVAADPAARLAAVWEGAADLAAAAGLTVQEVVLDGHRNAPVELLREAIAVRRGDPVLAFDPHGAKERLELISWVERAHVERHLSGRIQVRIEERRPFAIWQRDGRFAVVDREGRVVATENIGQFGRLPLVVGPGAGRVAAPMVELMRGAPEVMERTHALVRVAERRWNLRLRNGTDVLLPEGHEAAALARLSELHARQALLDRPLAAIDLRLPDKLVLRPPPPSPAAQGAPEGAAPPAAQQQQRARGQGRG